MKNIGDEATEEAVDEYGENSDTQTYGRGAQYRHVRRAYSAAREIGENDARHVTTIHEMGNPNFNPNDPKSIAKKAMDMDANNRGMELFKKHPKLSNKELREKIKEEIENGKSFRDFWPKRW